MDTDQSTLNTNQSLLMLQSLPLGVIVSDVSGKIRWVNVALCEMLGLTEDELLGKHRNGLPSSNTLRLSKSIHQLNIPNLAGRFDDQRFECFTQRINLEGLGEYELSCVMDVSHYERVRQLRDQSQSLESSKGPLGDLKRGILTKGVIMQELAAQVSRSRRYDNPLAVILMRVHVQLCYADQAIAVEMHSVLNMIAKLLKERLRWVDLLGYLDQDSFLFVLPETRVEPAIQLAEKINGHLGQLHHAEMADTMIDLSATFGVTEWRKGDDPMRLVDRAVEALGNMPGIEKQCIAVA